MNSRLLTSGGVAPPGARDLHERCSMQKSLPETQLLEDKSRNEPQRLLQREDSAIARITLNRERRERMAKAS